jgi:hypothetical protein
VSPCWGANVEVFIASFENILGLGG